jgi:uncharacterized membrane protein
MTYLILKWLHVLNAAVLFGAGAGIAFFMLMAWRTKDAAVFAAVARMVVLADFIFTATAVVLQPLTGVGLILTAGYAWNEPWLVASYALYVLTGACWLPVVWIQMRAARLAAAARERGEQALPKAARRLMRVWFWLGWPAFTAVAATYWLMIAKPDFN